MNPLQRTLEEWSIANSQHDLGRDSRYIGLSGIWRCPRVIYDAYMHPGRDDWRPDPERQLLHYLGYALEADIQRRLAAVGDFQPGIELCYADGLVRGHTDGSLDGRLIEIKTLPAAEYLPEEHLPRKVWWQVQAYLAYSSFSVAEIVYLARDTGELRVITAGSHASTQHMIIHKVNDLVEAVQQRKPPKCTCRQCEVLNA